MNPYEKMNLIGALERALDEAQKIPVTRSCDSCAYFDVTLKKCDYFKAAPPEDVQRVGCENWFFDSNSPPF